jgi:DNA-binding MarR family transcriptional regulator
MTGLVDTLERDGYVKREPDPTDRRTISVILTAKGERFLSDFLPGHFKLIAGLMATLNESERKTLVRLLGKIQQQASALRSEFSPLTASA